jgi:hypothetical protein
MLDLGPATQHSQLTTRIHNKDTHTTAICASLHCEIYPMSSDAVR